MEVGERGFETHMLAIDIDHHVREAPRRATATPGRNVSGQNGLSSYTVSSSDIPLDVFCSLMPMGRTPNCQI